MALVEFRKGVRHMSAKKCIALENGWPIGRLKRARLFQRPKLEEDKGAACHFINV
jgi:hypothetical protein